MSETSISVACGGAGGCKDLPEGLHAEQYVAMRVCMPNQSSEASLTAANTGTAMCTAGNHYSGSW